MGINWYFERFHPRRRPDGTDPLGKVIGHAKYGFLGSVALGLVRGSNLSTGFFNYCAYWVTPMTLLPACYASSVYALTRFRKKDDAFNYTLSVFTIAPFFHAFQRGWKPVTLLIFLGVPLTYIYKSLCIMNMDMINLGLPTVNWTPSTNMYAREHNMSLFDIGKTDEKH